MEGLKIELILRLLTYDAQVRPQCGLCDRLGVVVVVLLSLHERLHIDRRDDPRLVTQLTQRPADKVSAEARLHANDARRQPSKGLNERQSLDLATKSDLAVGAKTNDAEDFLADVSRPRVRWGSWAVFSGCCGKVLADYPGWGSSRSIPLADMEQLSATVSALEFHDKNRSLAD